MGTEAITEALRTRPVGTSYAPRSRTHATMLAILTEWLKDTTRSVGIGSNVVLAAPGDALAARSVEAGETLLELRSGACLTARAAYSDREMGRDLQEIAAQVGPGFDTVALATLCAVERVRGFEAETWYAGSTAAEQAAAPRTMHREPCTPTASRRHKCTYTLRRGAMSLAPRGSTPVPCAGVRLEPAH